MGPKFPSSRVVPDPSTPPVPVISTSAPATGPSITTPLMDLGGGGTTVPGPPPPPPPPPPPQAETKAPMIRAMRSRTDRCGIRDLPGIGDVESSNSHVRVQNKGDPLGPSLRTKYRATEYRVSPLPGFDPYRRRGASLLYNVTTPRPSECRSAFAPGERLRSTPPPRHAPRRRRCPASRRRRWPRVQPVDPATTQVTAIHSVVPWSTRGAGPQVEPKVTSAEHSHFWT